MKPEEKWHCIGGCGACCRLDPALRAEALEALNPQQQQTYLAMVGADGWCIHFDTGALRCRIYAQRPDFCRVENLVGLFQAGSCDSFEDPGSTGDTTFATQTLLQALVVDGDNTDTDLGDSTEQAAIHLHQEPTPLDASPLDELAIACCRQQIRSEWGGRGKVMRRFNRAVRPKR